MQDRRGTLIVPIVNDLLNYVHVTSGNVLEEITGKRSPAAVESTGVMLASLSTLGGLGTLMLATHPALHTLGSAVGLGIAISALTAVFLLPGLYRKEVSSG